MRVRPVLLTTTATVLLATAGGAAAAAVTPVAVTPATTTEYQLTTEPADGYQAVDRFISSATTTLDMTMYELADTTAQSALDADAARGVTVRVVLDVNREQANNQAAYDDLSSRGVHVVWASTTFAATHQKTITVDGTTSMIMSGNLTSRYYATSRDVEVTDHNSYDVRAIEKVFQADFTHTAITPTDGDNLVWSPTDSQDQLVGLVDGATTSLAVENEEMADPAVTDALVAAAKRGVAVQVTMTANSDYDSAFDQLVAAGVQVHLYAATASLYIHAKVIVADGHTAYAGSINFSDYSLNENRELGIITTDSGVVSGLAGTLASDSAGSTAYTG